MDRLKAANKDSRALHNSKIAVIGEETASVLSSYGLKHDLLPTRYTSAIVAEAFRHEGLAKGDKILLPSSEIARETLPSALTDMGAVVNCVAAYQNTIPTYDKDYLHKLFSRPLDLVTFTSSSTAANLAQLLKENDLGNQLAQMKGISIGPVTTKTAKDLSISVVAEAQPHTIPALVDAIVKYFKK